MKDRFIIAKWPLVKNKTYFTREGERVKYHSTTNFNWFTWVDKDNQDGKFMVSCVYEKTQQ